MSYREMHPKFKETFVYYEVPEEMKNAFWNYFAYGWSPGSFGEAILENKFAEAICRAHPALQLSHLRNMAKWLLNVAPANSYGSEELVKSWREKTDEERRNIMIEYSLRPSVVDILMGAPA